MGGFHQYQLCAGSKLVSHMTSYYCNTTVHVLIMDNAYVYTQIGDKVYVTQEIEDNMCVGVCNGHYCKFPKSILCILSGEDVITWLNLLKLITLYNVCYIFFAG